MLANVYSYELQSTGVSSRGTQDVLDGQSTGVSSQGPTQDVLVLLEINLFAVRTKDPKRSLTHILRHSRHS